MNGAQNGLGKGWGTPEVVTQGPDDQHRSGVSVADALATHKTKPPQGMLAGVLSNKSLTMTYFHRRPSTIIGAKAFHSPVRDGKVWDHLAMVVKRNRLSVQSLRDCTDQFGRSTVLSGQLIF